MSYSIGPGVAQAIAEAGDEPRSDEQYVILTESHKVSQTVGRDAIYYWIEEDNRVNRLPFEGSQALLPEITWDQWCAMPPQVYSWTCAACSLDWILRSTGLDPDSTRDQVVAAIGYPDNINAQYGLMDGSGSAISDVLATYAQPTERSWLGFDDVYTLALTTTGQISGGAWYHWVALRGVRGDNLWIANSAPGYQGVWDELSRADFERLGPFSVVWLVP